MFFNPESMSVNLIVTILVIVMVILMPWLDRRVCRKLGLSLHEGLDTNKDAEKLLLFRKLFLIAVFLVYLLCVSYVTFLSRRAASGYRINAGPLFGDFTNSFYIDFGFLDIINLIFTKGPAAALQHIRIISTGGIAQVYMNIAMLVPLGYLLPYIFDWFRRDVYRRTIPVCFFSSVLIENIQLLTKHGMYDLDDICTNTLGGIIGAFLFVVLAYINTNPNWRSEMKARRKWVRRSRRSAVFPWRDRIRTMRTTVYTSDEESVRDFFNEKLGFFLLKEIGEGAGKSLLYECGSTQIEIVTLPKGTALPPQKIMLSANNSSRMRKRLEKHGIPVSEYTVDDYSGRRKFEVESPEGLLIEILEI
ncbi:MAG: VanZ family protein [Solobacterium sp.]|nr:VanZ family protein [Solobacterium sp.]